MTSTALITKTYNDNTVLTFRNDGWFNMTKAAKAFGKESKEFLRLPSTLRYIESLEKVGISHLLETSLGRNGGTWAHPKLAVFFARWLDTDFAVWCDIVIDDILRGKADVVITKPEQSEILKMPTSLLETAGLWIAELRKNEALKLENNELKEEKALLEHEVTHFTISEYQTAAGRYFSPSQRGKLARHAAAYCTSKGLEIARKPMTYTNPSNGETYDNMVKVYPREALEHATPLVLN